MAQRGTAALWLTLLLVLALPQQPTALGKTKTAAGKPPTPTPHPDSNDRLHADDGPVPDELGKYVWRQEAVAHIASLTARYTFCLSRALEQDQHCAESAREYEKAGEMREWAAREPGWDTILTAAEFYEDASILLQEGLVADALRQLERSIALKLYPFSEPTALARWQKHLATPGEGFRRVRLELADALTLAADCALELAQGHGGGLAALVRAKNALETAAELRSVEDDTSALDASSGYMRVLQSEILAAAVDSLAQLRSREVRAMLASRGFDCRECSNIRALVRLALLLHLPPTSSLPQRARDPICDAAKAKKSDATGGGTEDAHDALVSESVRVRTLLGRAASFVSAEAFEAFSVPCTAKSKSMCTDGNAYVSDALLLCPPTADGLMHGSPDAEPSDKADAKSARSLAETDVREDSGSSKAGDGENVHPQSQAKTKGKSKSSGKARGGGKAKDASTKDSPMIEMDLQELFGGVAGRDAPFQSLTESSATASKSSATTSPETGAASFSTLMTKIKGDAKAEQEWAEILAEVIQWQNQHWGGVEHERLSMKSLHDEGLQAGMGSRLDAFTVGFADADGYLNNAAEFVEGDDIGDPSFDDARSELDRQLQEELSRQMLRDAHAMQRDGWEVPLTLALIGVVCALVWLARKHRRQLSRFSVEALLNAVGIGGKSGEGRAGKAGAASATAALRTALQSGDPVKVKRALETAEKIVAPGPGVQAVDPALLRRARTFLSERKRAEKALAEGKRREEMKRLEAQQKKKLEEAQREARGAPRAAPPPAPASTATTPAENNSKETADLIPVEFAKSSFALAAEPAGESKSDEDVWVNAGERHFKRTSRDVEPNTEEKGRYRWSSASSVDSGDGVMSNRRPAAAAAATASMVRKGFISAPESPVSPLTNRMAPKTASAPVSAAATARLQRPSVPIPSRPLVASTTTAAAAAGAAPPPPTVTKTTADPKSPPHGTRPGKVGAGAATPMHAAAHANTGILPSQGTPSAPVSWSAVTAGPETAANAAARAAAMTTTAIPQAAQEPAKTTSHRRSRRGGAREKEKARRAREREMNNALATNQGMASLFQQPLPVPPVGGSVLSAHGLNADAPVWTGPRVSAPIQVAQHQALGGFDAQQRRSLDSQRPAEWAPGGSAASPPVSASPPSTGLLATLGGSIWSPSGPTASATPAATSAASPSPFDLFSGGIGGIWSSGNNANSTRTSTAGQTPLDATRPTESNHRRQDSGSDWENLSRSLWASSAPRVE